MKYDFNFWLGIIGFVATIVFGILSIYLFKVKRYPGQITFIEEQVIGLFDSIVKNFPQINITYENSTIDKQVVLLKGILINTGSIDIKESMIDERLCLKLPAEFKWLSAKVIDSTKGSKTNLDIENNLLFVNSGLFRKNEFLRFEALADVPSRNGDDVSNTATSIFKQELKFEHRIADTDKVVTRTTELILPNLKNQIGSFKIVYMIFLVAAFFYCIFFLPDDSTDKAEFYFHLKTDTTVSVFKATPHLNGTILIESKTTKDTSNLKIDQFNSRLVNTEIRKWQSDSWLGNILFRYQKGIIICFLFFMNIIWSSFLYKPISEYRKIKKLRQSLKLDLI